ncbi:MAG: hypothetical protein N838_05595 [Thiohalocapsa sp. PB-PSB1]|nr:MAG: hypothetical protein N838_05595 [Thiohalocapsa sp. PB-PSB1]
MCRPAAFLAADQEKNDKTSSIDDLQNRFGYEFVILFGYGDSTLPAS